LRSADGTARPRDLTRTHAESRRFCPSPRRLVPSPAGWILARPGRCGPCASHFRTWRSETLGLRLLRQCCSRLAVMLGVRRSWDRGGRLWRRSHSCTWRIELCRLFAPRAEVPRGFLEVFRRPSLHHRDRPAGLGRPPASARGALLTLPCQGEKKKKKRKGSLRARQNKKKKKKKERGAVAAGGNVQGVHAAGGFSKIPDRLRRGLRGGFDVCGPRSTVTRKRPGLHAASWEGGLVRPPGFRVRYRAPPGLRAPRPIPRGLSSRAPFRSPL
jgi:hypothetical protein